MPQMSRRPSRETIHARHNLPPHDAAKRAVRLSNLKKLARAFGNIDEFAMAVELDPGRVDEMLQGKAPITSEMAMHLEDSLNLEGGWMESTDSKYAKADAGRVLVQKQQGPEPEIQESPRAKAAAPKPTVAVAEIAAITAPAQKSVVTGSGTPVKVVTKQHRVAQPPAAAAPQVSTPVATPQPPVPKVFTAPAAKPAPAAKRPPATAKPRVSAPVTKAVAPKKAAPVVAKAVSADKEMQQNIRRMNLALLTENKGEKARMSRILGIHASQLSLKLAGNRVMSDKFCGKIETAYGLPTGWMSEPRVTLPQAPIVPLKDFTLVPPASTPAVAKPSAVKAPRGPAAAKVAEAPAAEPVIEPTPAPVATSLAAPVSLTAGGRPSPLARALAEVILYRAATGALSDAAVTELLNRLMRAD